MDNLIIKHKGKGMLVEAVKNPFSFFLLYKEAADKKGQPVPSFSEKSIDFIRSLEKRYFFTR